MGRSKQTNPTRRDASQVHGAGYTNKKRESGCHDTEVLGRVTLDENEKIDELFVAQLYEEQQDDGGDILGIRHRQQHQETTHRNPEIRGDKRFRQRHVDEQRRLNKDRRNQKRRQTAIVDDDDSSDDDSDKSSIHQQAATSSNSFKSKRRRRVKFQDGNEEPISSPMPLKMSKTKSKTTKKKIRQVPRPTSQANILDVLEKESELIIQIQNDGICCVRYIGRGKRPAEFSTADHAFREIEQIELSSSRLRVELHLSSSNDGNEVEEHDERKLPCELPLEAGKSIVVLGKYLEQINGAADFTHQLTQEESPAPWTSLAYCVENGLLDVSLKVKCKSWVVSVAVTEKAFAVCHPNVLPLDRVGSAPRYKAAGLISSALAELPRYGMLPTAVGISTTITAKDIYAWTDNYQVRRLLNTEGKLPDPSSLEIPGLLPTLRPYQTAAVQWMLQRERDHIPLEEWKLSWVVLSHNGKHSEGAEASPSILSLSQWEEMHQLKHYENGAVLYCPIVGWLAKSVNDARIMSLGTEGDQVVVKGGILAESMGLGKTVEVIACILAHRRPPPTLQERLKSDPRRVLFTEEDTPEPQGSEHIDNVGDISEFGDAEEDSSSDDSTMVVPTRKLVNMTENPVNEGNGSVTPVTPDGSTDSLSLSESTVEERWLDGDNTVLGSCICGKVVDLLTEKSTSHIVLCCQCHEPMHMECAGFSDFRSLKHSNKEVTYRKMFSNQIWKCWVTRNYRNCPCCVAEKNDVIESRGTLIITPPAILNQWDREIERHARNNELGGPLKVAIYRGVDKTTKSRRRDMNTIHPYMLADHDIVLMTFDSLMTDFGHSDENKFVGADSSSNLRKRKRYRVVPSPLSAIHWWRVCLDEAQRVERPTAASARMALKLKSEHRWCVTGTPIGRGKLEDLYGLLLFLRLDPFMLRKFFNKALDPSHPDIASRIKALLANIFWRSTKSIELVREQMGVPEQQERKNFLRFSSIEKHFYDRQLEATLSAAGDFAERRRSGKHDKTKQLNLLADHLHRLRAACCHPQVGAGGINKSKKNGSFSESGVGSRVLSMEEILVRLIDDARLKCEESQRRAGLHTNAMASLSRLKVEAKERGGSTGISESDDILLMKSCKLYLEGLELGESNSIPTPVLADAALSGSMGFRSPRGIMKGGTAILEWKLEGSKINSSFWSRVDFDGPARRIARLRIRPVYQVPETLRAGVSPDFKWTVLIPRTCSLEVSNPNLGGEFVEVAKFPCSGSGDVGWIMQDRFRTHKSRSWRIVIDTLHETDEGADRSPCSFYVGVEVKFDEADIASDPFQKLHALHNASLSFASLIQQREAMDKDDCSGSGPFANISTMTKKMNDLNDEAKCIESQYMQGAQALHKACGQRLKQSSNARKEAEDGLRRLIPSMGDCWDAGWWDDFLVACQVYGDEQQKNDIFLRVYDELRGYQGGQNENMSRLIKFPEVSDLSGLHIALRSRINGIRTGIGKKSGWLGTMEEGTYQLRWEYFKCSQGMHARCMKAVAGLPVSPTNSELYENKHCRVCKAEWYQQGPKCRHCIIGDELSELEPDRVTLFLLNTLSTILRGSIGSAITSQNEDTLNLPDRAKAFFDVLEAQKREKVCAWRFWRTHLDLLNDLDELGQCKESMRLSFEGEDLTSLTRDQLNAVVMPCDVVTQYHDHAAKQAMSLGDLRRSKETLRYLRNQSVEVQQRSEKDEDAEQCAVCLCSFESDRAVLRCGHSFHMSPCLEKLKRGNGSICCPMRCRVQTNADDVLIASNKRRDDGTSTKRSIKGSWGTKVTKVVSDLLDIRDLGEKAILFSQWEDMLDIVAEALSSNNVPFARTASLAKIGDTLKIFRSEDCTVLMLNVKKGAEGLTILEARHVLMLEPLLNNALDAQAINRVCRIGQKHKTTVHRYIVEGTVETKIDAVRMEHEDEVIEDTKAKHHAIRAGGVDGGFATEDELMNILSAATDDQHKNSESSEVHIAD